MQNNSNFAEFKYYNNIWAIGSIHSHTNSFESIKDHIIKNFSTNDKVVFLGNIIGVGKFAQETLSSVIDMRRNLMSKFYLMPEDIIFLRGSQEEMFLKLLQLQTAPHPSEILNWMYKHGVDKTGNSIVYTKELEFENKDEIRIACIDWSDKMAKENNWIDGMFVALSSDELLTWVSEEAFK